VAHRYDSKGRAGGGGNPSTWQALGHQNRYTYSKVARLMQRLAERDLLQDTVIVAMSDMGDPARHSSRQIPTLLAGGWGGQLKGGRHLDLGAAGTPNNRLLVSVQRAFGVESDTFGQSTDPTLLSGSLDLG
jgi:arylsulfatase A-like enzyme